MDRFSKLYKNSATLKAEQKISMQLSKKQEAVEANGNGTSGIRISEGVNKGKVLGHNKVEKKKALNFYRAGFHKPARVYKVLTNGKTKFL